MSMSVLTIRRLGLPPSSRASPGSTHGSGRSPGRPLLFVRVLPECFELSRANPCRPEKCWHATSSAILIVAAYSFFARLAQDYVETLMNDNLCHLSTSRRFRRHCHFHDALRSVPGPTMDSRSRTGAARSRHTIQDGDLHCRPHPHEMG